MREFVCPLCLEESNSMICQECKCATLPKDMEIAKQLHHINGPSSLDRRMSCPGSMRMEAESWLAKSTSEDAEEGKRLHHYVQMDLSGEPYEGFSAEAKEIVDSCAILAKGLAQGSAIKTEVSVSAIGSDFKRLFCGTCDVIIIQGKKAIVIDWKFGRNEVEESSSNIQLAAYALAVSQQFGVESVECHVFQPRINHHSQHTYVLFDELQATIEKVIANCKQPNAPLVFGDHCTYCRGKQTCPEFRKMACAPLTTLEPSYPPVCKWQDEELSQFKYRCGMLEKIKAIVDIEIVKRAKTICSCGNEEIRKKCISGRELTQEEREKYCKHNGRCGEYGFTKPRRTRQIEDVSAAYTAMSGMLSAEEFTGACKLQWGAAVEKVATKHQIKATEAGKRIEAALGDAMKWNFGEPSLKRSGAKEEAE